MIIERTLLSNCYLIKFEPKFAARGYLSRTYCSEEFSKVGLNTNWPQRNVSYSKNTGTVRGLHFQVNPTPEIKIVRCTSGSIFDVVVDIDFSSKTFGTWAAFNLTEGDNQELYIGAGLAHGFQTLESESEVEYSHSVNYVPGNAMGISAFDARLAIPWPKSITLVSENDLNLPTLEAYGSHQN